MNDATNKETLEEKVARQATNKMIAKDLAKLAGDSFNGMNAPGAKLMRFCEEELKLSPQQAMDLMLLTSGFIGATASEKVYKPSAHELILLMTGAMVVETVSALIKAEGGEDANQQA